MRERRKTTRYRVLKGARIEFNRAGGLSCTVRNLSIAGACLEVDSVLGIPDSFRLMIDGDRALHHCKIAWRSTQRIGVAFEDHAQSRQQDVRS